MMCLAQLSGRRSWGEGSKGATTRVPSHTMSGSLWWLVAAAIQASIPPPTQTHTHARLPFTPPPSLSLTLSLLINHTANTTQHNTTRTCERPARAVRGETSRGEDVCWLERDARHRDA
jgi:hypothetical protein